MKPAPITDYKEPTRVNIKHHSKALGDQLPAQSCHCSGGQGLCVHLEGEGSAPHPLLTPLEGCAVRRVRMNTFHMVAASHHKV